MTIKRPARRHVVRIFWSSSPSKRHRKRLGYALGLSLSLHVFILSLQFGAPGLGLPGISLPWEERRMQAVELTVRLMEAPRPPLAAPAAPALQLALSTELSLKTAPQPKPRAAGSFEVVPQAPKPPPALSEPERVARASAPAAKTRARDRKVRKKPSPQLLAQTDPQHETFKVPAPKPVEPEVQRAPDTAARKKAGEPRPDVKAAEEAARRQAEEAARLALEEAARQRAEEEARERALASAKELEEKKLAEARRLELARKEEEARQALEARRLAEEAERQEAEALALERALALAKEIEAKKLEEAKKIEEARQAELKKEEEARKLALELENLKRIEDAARIQAEERRKALEAQRLAEEAAARAKAAAERERAEAEAAAQRERDRLAASKGPATAPGALPGKDLAAKLLDQLRTPGAASADPSRASPPPARADNPRRRSLFGVERDVSLRMYVDSWRSKIERHGALNYRRAAAWRTYDNPVVTVAIRSDGSLEDVLIHRSSGVREIDEAVQRISRLLAPYSAFPPALASRYDVIEIRREWFFDTTLKIVDEIYR